MHSSDFLQSCRISLTWLSVAANNDTSKRTCKQVMEILKNTSCSEYNSHYISITFFQSFLFKNFLQCILGEPNSFVKYNPRYTNDQTAMISNQQLFGYWSDSNFETIIDLHFFLSFYCSFQNQNIFVFDIWNRDIKLISKTSLNHTALPPNTQYRTVSRIVK